MTDRKAAIISQAMVDYGSRRRPWPTTKKTRRA